MPNTNQPKQPDLNDRPDESRKEDQVREHICKLPDTEDIPPDQERGERIGTAKTIATSGEGDEACEEKESQEARTKSP